MNQHQVVVSLTRGMVERDWANVLGVRLFGRMRKRNQRGLFGERQADLDDLADVVGGQAQLALGVAILLEQLANVLGEVALELEHLPRRLDLGFGLTNARHRVALAAHRSLDIVGQHRAVTSQVFANRLDLLRHPHQKFEVSVEIRSAWRKRPCR